MKYIKIHNSKSKIFEKIFHQNDSLQINQEFMQIKICFQLKSQFDNDNSL